MKVLYFSDNCSGHNQRFLEKLSQAGIEVWFLDPTSSGPKEGWLPRDVHWVQSRQILPSHSDPTIFAGFLAEFQRVQREVVPDLVHAGPVQTCGYVTSLSQFHPWLLTSWGSDLLAYSQRNEEWGQATRVALSSADGFFCDCYTVRARAKQFADIPDSRIVQFPWGLQKGLFGPSGSLPPKELWQPETGTYTFLSTRSWEPLYGIDTLLQAFLQAYREDPRLRLVLLGNGSLAGTLREFIEVHKLGRVIQTPGSFSKQDMPKWFRAADFYVSCAQSDGTSVSLLEAMATGLPVVVTDIPSNREWVVEGENGWLAPANSADEFSDRLLRAATICAEERSVIAEANQRIVRERADWDRNFPRLLDMYQRITSGG